MQSLPKPVSFVYACVSHPLFSCYPVWACVVTVCACWYPLGGKGCARLSRDHLGKVPRPGVVPTRPTQAVKPQRLPQRLSSLFMYFCVFVYVYIYIYIYIYVFIWALPMCVTQWMETVRSGTIVAVPSPLKSVRGRKYEGLDKGYNSRNHRHEFDTLVRAVRRHARIN